MFTVRAFDCFVPLQTFADPAPKLGRRTPGSPISFDVDVSEQTLRHFLQKSAYFHHDNCTRHQLPFVLTPFCVSPSFFPAGPAGAFESESLGLEVHRAGNFLWHRSVGFVDIKVGSFASLQPGTCLQLAGCKSFEGASRG